MSIDHIQALETWEAIRKRPSMFVKLDETAPNELLKEALCMARSSARRKEGITKITIPLFKEGRAIINDDGPGWPVDMHRSGKRMAEHFLRDLFGCREAKDENDKGVCNSGVVTLVALCSWFNFTTNRDGHFWAQDFVNGQPSTAFRSIGESKTRGTMMCFQLDKTLLPHVEFDLEDLTRFAEELRGEGLQVVVDQG